ncbi:urease accessory protein UreF [Coprinopsis marcescibilis]|uniref:Urease accessory protein UreF n=1 Tax=Coprinopsis marcescibilis TaxID=230819 RepID=A0A5C3KJJ8_COPMA|nr:urease accessory protein UreF [Coprinopsis marcescibilis]
MDHDEETYLLLLLSDSNLPTGAFVASSGFESYLKHAVSPSPSTGESRTIDFLRDGLASYARTSLPFVSDTHRLVAEWMDTNAGGEEGNMVGVVGKLSELDKFYEAQTLNHVARRASRAQGAALLTLYARGFSRPASLVEYSDPDSQARVKHIARVVEHFKLQVRREDTPGHLPVCWGILTAALGLSLDRSQYLHLFLNARSILSASIRLNEIGPYNSQQILLHAVSKIIAVEKSKCQNLRTGFLEDSGVEFDETIHGPANTWPLGEILASRHDLQHSRIFNS